MGWRALALAMTFAVMATVGCKQQCFLTEPDFNHYRALGLPENLESDTTPSVLPMNSQMAAPATTLDPEREIHPLSMAEAFAIALEHGTAGSPTIDGTTNDQLALLNGRTLQTLDNSIRVLALDPAIAGTDIEAALSKFDVRWTTSMNWSTLDHPVASPLEVIQAANRVSTIQNSDAMFQTGLLKPLPTGGVAGITFRTDYELTNLPARVNPAYRPTLQFQFEQPLLQGFGVEVNELRATHPGSLLTPFPTASRVEGILITRLRFDQQRAEFERQVHIQLANVEVAYWNLYGAYGNLYTREQAMQQALEAWRLNQSRFNLGKISIQDFAQTRAQYEMFRGQRVDALGQVLASEHQLRGLLGLAPEDGTRLIPVEVPTLAPFHPDWTSSLNQALASRPELVLARDDLKFRQLDLINQKNLLQPDLRVTSTYGITGIGNHLDGGSNDSTNAFQSLASDKFIDWNIGLVMNMPLGFRDAHAAVRAAHLNIARSYLFLRDQEQKAQRYVSEQYRLLFQNYMQIETRRSEREALALQLEARYKDFVEGRGSLDLLLQAQRFWADSLGSEYSAIANYNNSLARFEYAKGTILQRDNIVIAEGPLPQVAKVRAVEHQQERSKALIARERANPVICPTRDYNGIHITGLPQMQRDVASPIPSLLEKQPSLPENLPVPAKVSNAGAQGINQSTTSLNTNSIDVARPASRLPAQPEVIQAAFTDWATGSANQMDPVDASGNHNLSWMGTLPTPLP